MFVEEYRSFRSSLCSFFHSPVTSSLLGSNILFSTLFWHTLSQRISPSPKPCEMFHNTVFFTLRSC
jgi:hypothetical protein